LNEACAAISKGDCKAAIVGGTNLILAPGLTATASEQGILSPNASCKTFSADADGYARAEGIVAIYIKPLKDALLVSPIFGYGLQPHPRMYQNTKASAKIYFKALDHVVE
jgi:3-oxoacyl-(acyl-carrier-protein) synthase